ncbi:sarcolemmal membrane-associated protein isoform X1 [Folsomia candida]|uniref:sarcolemmal membrane-associated protein isoform X1 n=1 Tax=Folsomia candida TaxID=158441 RepID=UPI001604F7A8|nr:sarcolemmal membrane-associated protein isoform X1 [Folsomia candida]
MRKLTEDEMSGSSSDSEQSTSSCVTVGGGSGGGGTFRMAAKAVLTCRPNSHPFQERTLILDQPAKIGRSVARARPNGNNAIFDCKVLSRNHALLWHENGKFFLQDTKSSNGTFVNNQRLSKSSEESAPREVCSGDIVQFGVDVMEVNKKSLGLSSTVTHGCIVANLQLFLPDGKEAKASSSTTLPDKASNTPLQDIYLLNGYVKEGMQKEQMIEHKLAAITKLLLATKESANSNWKAMIEEDRLLTRIDILERQLETSHKSMTDERLREEIVQLQEDKEKYQTVAKEALRKSMQDKMDIAKKYHDLEKNIQTYLKEKELYKQLSEQRNDELQELADKFEKAEEKSKELEDEIAAQTLKYKEELEELNKKLKEGEDLLLEKQKIIDALIAKIDSRTVILTAHNDNTKVILPENDSNKLIENDELADGETAKEITENTDINKTGDVESMTFQLVSAELEKKEIQARLSQILTLFEDLKAVSNKSQPSEYLSELIGKVDGEIHQIKNFIHGDDSIKNNYNITEKLNEINAENHVNRLNSDATNGVEKLLEESRDTIKALQSEASLAKRQFDNLQEKYSACAIDIEKYKKQFEGVSENNSVLVSRLCFAQEKLVTFEQQDSEWRDKFMSQTETLETKTRLIESLEGELRALKSPKVGQNDLNRGKQKHNIALEVACQTIQDSATSNSSALQSFNVSSDLLNSSVSSDSVASDLQDRLLSTEEELAVYKHRFSESSAACAKLSRECLELRSEQDTLFNQSKVQLCYIIPIVILILAILIGLRPSS